MLKFGDGCVIKGIQWQCNCQLIYRFGTFRGMQTDLPVPKRRVSGRPGVEAFWYPLWMEC